VFAVPDLEAARSIKLFLDAGLSEDAIAEITRVLGETMARLAATMAGTSVDAFLKPATPSTRSPSASRTSPSSSPRRSGRS
jgi:hypothetical protein